MIVFRDALLILIIAQIGCTTPLRIECSKDEIKSWHIANRSTITKQINYPPQAQRLQKHGKVVVALAVNEEGSAEESFIKQSSGSPVLDTEALKIAKAKYSPPVCSGKKTAMIVDVLINFDIRD